MNKLSIIAFNFLFLLSFSALGNTKTYGLHLYFDEKEFVDVLVLEKKGSTILKGHMFVPNDFEGPIENIKKSELSLSFDLLVPKNRSRNEDMIFEYVGHFFDKTEKQLIGFVKLKGTNKFIGSFVAFQREQKNE